MCYEAEMYRAQMLHELMSEGEEVNEVQQAIYRAESTAGVAKVNVDVKVNWEHFGIEATRGVKKCRIVNLPGSGPLRYAGKVNQWENARLPRVLVLRILIWTLSPFDALLYTEPDYTKGVKNKNA